MLLAIDAGNTNLVFALVDGDEIKARWRIATDPRRTADEYAVWLHQLLQLEGFPKGTVDKVIIGTVVPRALHNLEVLATKYFGVTPMVAGQGAAAWPIVLDVDEPRHAILRRELTALAIAVLENASTDVVGHADIHRAERAARHDVHEVAAFTHGWLR
jgi:type III pantothenate kinase